MGSPPSPENGDLPAFAPEDSSGKAASSPHHKMSPRNRALFFLTAWLIVLMPFLFWWNTWFGRQLSDKQIGEFLNDEKHPRHIQHALVQLGEHMGRHDPGVKPLYPELIRLAWHPVEEVRNTDAWVMGQDTAGTGFHEALLKMLEDSSPMVRGNAALSLVRFGDASGRAQIVALLQSARIIAPRSGRVTDVDKAGTPIHQGGLVAKLQDGRPVTVDLVEQTIDAELAAMRATVDDVRYRAYERAAVLMRKLIESPTFPEFLTVPAYAEVLKEEGLVA